jgi:hypothetical protein
MLRSFSILTVLSAACAGCNAPSFTEPNAYAALPLAGHQVYESHGYSVASSIDFVLIEIYSDPETAQQTSNERVKDDVLKISLNVGDQQIGNIRGTQKLYIIHDDQLTIYDLDCDDGDVSDVVGSIPHFKTVDEFIESCVETLTSTNEDK